ncbi:hypothetical protein ACFONB_06575 [Sphingopyxis italica]|uniref:hypothetical protein n=1 Tax=Sphingopyxis italica TaxID=1129133 RepID=UPI001ADBE4E9|nr:hypothetical protein [Sphingopyxis italica]
MSLHSAIALQSAAVRADDEISEALLGCERQLFEPLDFFHRLLRRPEIEVLEFLAIGNLYTSVGVIREQLYTIFHGSSSRIEGALP